MHQVFVKHYKVGHISINQQTTGYKECEVKRELSRQ